MSEAGEVANRNIFASAIVVTKHLLIHVTTKMKRFNSNVGSAKTALQETPEVLDALSVYLAANILLRVIDDLMRESLRA